MGRVLYGVTVSDKREAGAGVQTPVNGSEQA